MSLSRLGCGAPDSPPCVVDDCAASVPLPSPSSRNTVISTLLLDVHFYTQLLTDFSQHRRKMTVVHHTNDTTAICALNK